MQFNEGDVVVLKSGGPTMTVERVNGENVGCVWFEKNSHRQAQFRASSLKVYEEALPMIDTEDAGDWMSQ